MIYSDLFRFLGLLTRRLTFFQALIEQAFSPRTEHGDGPCRHLNTTMNHKLWNPYTGHSKQQLLKHVQLRVYVEFYLFLRLFNLLIHYLLLALSWRAVLLTENVAILVIFIEKVKSFLGFGLLLCS